MGVFRADMCFPPSDALPSPVLPKPRRCTFPSLPDRHSLHRVSRPQRRSLFLHESDATSHKRGVQPRIRRGCSFSIELDQTFEANRLGVHCIPTSRSEGNEVVEPDWGGATSLWGSNKLVQKGSQISQQQSQWLPSLFSNPKETAQSPWLPPASPPETRSDLLLEQAAEARARPGVIKVGFTQSSGSRRNSICSNSSEERSVFPTQKKRLRQRTRAKLGAQSGPPPDRAHLADDRREYTPQTLQLRVHAVKVTHSLAAASAKRTVRKAERPSPINVQATRGSQQQPRATSHKTAKKKSATEKVQAAEADAYCCAVPASETDSDNDWDVGPWNAICTPLDSIVSMCVDEFPTCET